MRQHLLCYVLSGEQELELFRQKEWYVQSHIEVNKIAFLEEILQQRAHDGKREKVEFERQFVFDCKWP